GLRGDHLEPGVVADGPRQVDLLTVELRGEGCLREAGADLLPDEVGNGGAAGHGLDRTVRQRDTNHLVHERPPGRGARKHHAGSSILPMTPRDFFHAGRPGWTRTSDPHRV